MTTNRYLVIRKHTEGVTTVIDELSIMDTAELIAAALRVCARRHLHDTAAMARACDLLPGPPPRVWTADTPPDTP